MEIITSEDDMNEESTTHQPDTKPATDTQLGILYSITVHLLAQDWISYSKIQNSTKKASVLFSCFFYRAMRRDGPLDLTTIPVHNAVDSYNYNSTF